VLVGVDLEDENSRREGKEEEEEYKYSESR
jgi:hypothetical protein